MFTSKRSVLHSKSIVFFIGLLLSFGSRVSYAQYSGISAESRDFYIGYMPGIPHNATFIGSSTQYVYALVGSMADNNTAVLSYFGQDGVEIQSNPIQLKKGQVKQVVLDRLHMMPARPGETPEFKAGHIRSKYPVTVQILMEGSSAGGMYQAIPTSALGKNYVVSAWVDNPTQDNPGFLNRDSSSSEFMMIATQDNTKITFTPNATTCAGVIGMNTGAGATGSPHPTQITLQRGQVYWVRSFSIDNTSDLTGSTIQSDKPIAVLGGQERALLGDPSGVWATLDNDIRDVMIEQMTPVESWGSEYPTIPFMPPPEVPRLLQNGEGDMYRCMTNDANAGTMDMWVGPNQPYSRQVGPYQAPAAQWNNVMDPQDFIVATLNKDGSRKKMYMVMYDYFQGQHDFSPGSSAHHGKGGGETPQGNGGDQVQDEMTYTCPNEMDLVPIDRYETSTVFKVPVNSLYKSYQYMNIILARDSVKYVTVMKDGANKKPLSAYTPAKKYSIPFHPELVGLTIQTSPGDYLIYGNTPFACYTYGRTQETYKDGWGYAAPSGQTYGSQTELVKPKAQITPGCDHWDVRITDAQPGDEGLADVMLLNDPDGFFAKPGRVSFNVSMQPTDVIVNPGDTSVSFTIHVNDIGQDAYAAVLAVDRAGNDTVFEFHFKAQRFTLSNTSLDFGSLTVGDSGCQTVTLKVLAAGSSDTVTVTPMALAGKSGAFRVTSAPTLPSTMHIGDSIVYTICFSPSDSIHYTDKLKFTYGCIDSNMSVLGAGTTPIIYAQDLDFGAVAIGDTSCKQLQVENRGNQNLILDSNWVFHNVSSQFIFKDAARMPITLAPHQTTMLNFCFAPLVSGPDYGRQDWGTNLRVPFLHQIKDTSRLLGFGVKPGLTWDRPDQAYTVVCDSMQLVRVNLLNPDPHNGQGKTETVSNVTIEGPDKDEFAIVDDQLGYVPIENVQPWPIAVGATVWMDVRFKPDLSKGYGVRHAKIVAVGTSGSPELPLTGTLRHGVLSIDPPSHDFGIQLPGSVHTQTFMLHNTGDTDVVFQGIPGLSGDFTVLSGPAIGDHLKAGDSIPVVVQVTAPAAGASAADVTASSMTGTCTPPVDAPIKIFAADIAVSGTDHPFGLVYECKAGKGTVSGLNIGLKGAILDSVKIGNAPGMADADEFSFDGLSRRDTFLTAPIRGGGSIDFDVHYVPIRAGAAGAQITYYWRDTSKTPNVVIPVQRALTGNGYAAKNTLSLHKDYGDQVYSATTMEYLTIPVQLKQTFDNLANVYGLHFTVRYLRDQFIFDPNRTDYGGLITATPATPVADPADNNYELVTFDLKSQTPILRQDTVAHLTWQYVVAKDSITNFEFRDVSMLDESGQPTCWVTFDVVPGVFYGKNECGDYTLREFLRKGSNFTIDGIAPNPIGSSTRITYDIHVMNTPMTIDVVNALGEPIAKVMRERVHDIGRFETIFDATGIPNGMYTIRFMTPGHIATKSILVTR